MDNTLIVSETIEIKAPVSRVWKGLTDPQIIKDYLFGTETVTDWKVGSDIIFQGTYNGQQYQDKGKIQEYILHQLISYSYWSSFTGTADAPENYSRVTYRLSPVNDQLTRFTWTQKGFASEQAYEHSKKGMKDFMQQIKETIEKF
jgi:uncharacterized protein YndB with AHSA1/START domain